MQINKNDDSLCPGCHHPTEHCNCPIDYHYENGYSDASAFFTQKMEKRDARYLCEIAHLSLQLERTQNALKGLHRAVIKSQSANDPLGMASAMDEAGKWF